MTHIIFIGEIVDVTDSAPLLFYRPRVSSLACRQLWRRVTEKLPIHDVREPPFQAAQRFPVTLSGGAFPLVVSAAGCVSADLGDGHGVQDALQLPVSGAGKTVPDDVAGGRLDQGGAGVMSKRRR